MSADVDHGRAGPPIMAIVALLFLLWLITRLIVLSQVPGVAR